MDEGKALMFESVFNQIKLPVTILRANIPHFTIVAMNDQRKNAPGTPQDAVGKDAFDVYKSWDEASEAQFSLLKNGMIEAIREKKPVKLQLLYFEFPLQDGTIQRAWVQSDITPVFDADGSVTYLLSIAQDVTEVELSRLALQKSEEVEHQLREELSTTNEVLIATNTELSVVNEELACTNEELESSNEELEAANEELVESRLRLEVLNSELEERILVRTKALTESENRFRTMFETISQMAWAVTGNAEGIFYNKTWYEYTGLDYELSKGFGWQSVMHPDDVSAGIAKFRQMQAGITDSSGIENRFRRADGMYRWHLTKMLPVKNEHGVIEMWIGTATDIHELKELQQKKDDFITIASHELKTPITALKASLQLLDKMKDITAKEMMPKLIFQSRRSIQRISTLIEDLLSVSQFQQGKLSLNKNAFKVVELLNASCNHISVAGKHTIQITGDRELEIYADEHRIEQVVINFVNNAVKYAPDSKNIDLSVINDRGMVKVCVTDHGPGIPADKIPFLFDRYYKVDAYGYQNSGLGLGLYISAEIIQQHNGKIGVDSEVGKGSTFWFTVPQGD